MSQTLSVSIYRPAGKARASLLIVHGMAEHRKRYDDFARYLQKKGYAVMTYDLPGHGETAESQQEPLGFFGETNGWERLVNSAVETARECRRLFPDAPFVLMGHSMGTIIARCFLQENDAMLNGLILSGAPAYNKAVPSGLALAKTIRLTKGARGYSKTLDNLVTGGFSKAVKDAKTPFDWLSCNEENVQKYIADPLCGFPFTVQGYIDELTGMVQMHDLNRFRTRNPSLPILMFCGEDDPCTGGKEGWTDSIAVLQQAGYQNLSSHRYPHMRHETLNETYNLRVYEDVWQWLEAALF